MISRISPLAWYIKAERLVPEAEKLIISFNLFNTAHVFEEALSVSP